MNQMRLLLIVYVVHSYFQLYVEIIVTRLEIYVDKSKFIGLVELEETDPSMDSNSNLEHINNT